MKINSKISKVKKYRKISDSEYQLQSQWTSSDTVEMSNGNSLEKELKNMNTEIDNKLSAIETNIDWKESVNSYEDILTTYPHPEDGWTVNTKTDNLTYRYSGSAWVAISANAIPKATQSVDGLLTKEDKSNYDDANNKKHTHSNKSVLDGITSALIAAWNSAVKHITDTVKHITPSERTKWNTAYDKANDALPKTGGTLIGSLDIYGNASQNPLRTRGIVGSDGQGNDGDLYLQYGSAGNIYLGKNGSGCIDNDGKSYNGTAMSSRYPFGFNSYTPADITWGVQTGTPLVTWNTSDGGSIGFRDNCPVDGQVSMVVDGRVYQDEGRYPVLDSNNYTSVITKQGICDILGYTPSTGSDSFEIGGTNLFQGTKEFEITNAKSFSNTVSSVTSEIYNGLKIRKNLTAWNFYRPILSLEPGNYVFSGYVKGVNGLSTYIQVSAGDTILNAYTFSITSDWKRYSITFEITEKSDVTFFLESREAGEIYECGWKLEKGNKATDWSPAPEDLAPVSGSQHYVKVFNSGNVNSSNNLTVNDLADQGFAAAMIGATEDSPTGSGWFHALNMGWDDNATTWTSQLAIGTEHQDGLYYRTTNSSSGISGKPWKRVLDSSNYTNYALKAESLSDIDLNNVTTSGIYHLSGNLTNNPLSCNATLLVDFNVGTPYQIFMPDYTYNMYKRTYSSSTWGEWYEFGGSSSSSVAWDNITGRPSSYPPSNHNHGTADPNFTCFLTDNTSAGFSALHDNGATTGFFLKTIRGQYTAPGWFEGDYASGIAFGGADTHAVISCRYNFPRVTFAGGNGTEPNWWMRLAGTSGHSYNMDDFATSGIESYGSSDNYVFSDCYGSGSGTNYYYIRYTNGIQMIFIEIHNDNSRQNVSQGSGKKTISFPVSFVNNKYFAFGKQNISSDASGNNLVSFSEKNTSSIDVRHYPYGYNEAADYFSMFFVGRWK